MTDFNFIEVESKETGNRFLIDPANLNNSLTKVETDSADKKKKETV